MKLLKSLQKWDLYCNIKNIPVNTLSVATKGTFTLALPGTTWFVSVHIVALHACKSTILGPLSMKLAEVGSGDVASSKAMTQKPRNCNTSWEDG